VIEVAFHTLPGEVVTQSSFAPTTIVKVVTAAAQRIKKSSASLPQEPSTKHTSFIKTTNTLNSAEANKSPEKSIVEVEV